jgi:hypothetical protein
MIIGVFFLSAAMLSIFLATNLLKPENYESITYWNSSVGIISLAVSYFAHFCKNESLKAFWIEVLIGIGVSVILLALLTWISNGWMLDKELIELNFKALSETKDKDLKAEYENLRVSLLYFSGGIGILLVTLGFLIRGYIVSKKGN